MSCPDRLWTENTSKMVPEVSQNSPIWPPGGLAKLMSILDPNFMHMFYKSIIMFRCIMTGTSSKNMCFPIEKHTFLKDLRIMMLLGF